MKGYNYPGNSPAKHGGHRKFKTETTHEEYHDEKGYPPGNEKGERDFSEHNIAARRTEGTIEEQKIRRGKLPPYKKPVGPRE